MLRHFLTSHFSSSKFDVKHCISKVCSFDSFVNHQTRTWVNCYFVSKFHSYAKAFWNIFLFDPKKVKIIFLFFQDSMKKPSTINELTCFKPLIETFSSFLFSQFKILETLIQQRLLSILLWITRLELKHFVSKI